MSLRGQVRIEWNGTNMQNKSKTLFKVQRSLYFIQTKTRDHNTESRSVTIRREPNLLVVTNTVPIVLNITAAPIFKKMICKPTTIRSYAYQMPNNKLQNGKRVGDQTNGYLSTTEKK